MEKFNEVKLNIYERFNNGEITESEKDVLIDVLEERTIDSLCNEVYTEGVNLDSRAKFKEAKKQTKDAIKSAKASIKSGKYSDAVSELNKVKQVNNDTIKYIESLDTTTGSNILGFIVTCVITEIKMFIVAIPTFGIGSIIIGVKDLLKQISAIEHISKSKDFTEKDFNMYKNKLIGILLKYNAKIDDMIKKVKTMKPESDTKVDDKKED